MGEHFRKASPRPSIARVGTGKSMATNHLKAGSQNAEVRKTSKERALPKFLGGDENSMLPGVPQTDETAPMPPSTPAPRLTMNDENDEATLKHDDRESKHSTRRGSFASTSSASQSEWSASGRRSITQLSGR